ncbi:hydroxymethylbilane synthase [Tritonibacter multivorans]|nr:hydroxymethylbilane synthase [Tritonibacter multivorans]
MAVAMTLTLPSPASPLKIGTRGSPLALAQAYETRARLSAAFSLPEEAFEIVVIQTTGDNRAMIDADRPLKEIGNKGLFTKEIEEAMLAGTIDIAVHSTKDMPTVQPEGLVIDCFLPREDVRDAFVSPSFKGIADLPEGAVVGSSSLRRRAQLLYRRPDLKVVEFRGNVQTRLKKLNDGVAQCTFLAMAGLSRLDMLDQVPATAVEVTDMLPAVAQGAICIERRISDDRTGEMLAAIHHGETGQRLTAERAFLEALDGSCETPIAGLAELTGGQLHLRGELLRPDGSEAISGALSGAVSDARDIGQSLAAQLRNQAGPGFFDWHS